VRNYISQEELPQVRLTDNGVGGVERGTISPMYSESEVDDVGVSRVRVNRGKRLDMNDNVGTILSFCFFLLTYTSQYLDSPLSLSFITFRLIPLNFQLNHN
jgi:hypothetical protein